MQKNRWNVLSSRCTNRGSVIKKVSRPCTDDPQFAKDDFEIVGELADVCAMFLEKVCTLHASVDLTFYGQSKASLRAAAKWNRVCDSRLARQISFLKGISGRPQLCHVGGTANECKQGLFQDADFGDLADSK